MKALELTVFPASDGTHRTFIGGQMEGYCLDCRQKEKRLTDAELAAEYHANEVEAWRMTSRRPEFYDIDQAERLEDRESILHRFATLPHYDEVDQ